MQAMLLLRAAGGAEKPRQKKPYPGEDSGREEGCVC